MRRLTNGLGVALGHLLAALLGIIVALATIDVGLWALAARSWAPMAEIEGVLMVWFGLLGAAWGVEQRFHLGLTVMARRLPPRWQGRMRRLAAALVAGFGILLAFYGARLVVAVGNTLPATGWPAAVQYVPAVAAGALIALFGVADLIAPRPAVGLETDAAHE